MLISYVAKRGLRLNLSEGDAAKLVDGASGNFTGRLSLYWQAG